MEFNATFLVSAISFIIFTFIMNIIFYKPIEKIMDERQRFINEAKSDALNSNTRADEILKDRETRLNKSIADSKKIVAEKVNTANENSRALTGQAKQKSQEEIASAKLNLQQEAQLSKEELKAKVKDLAEVISSKITGIDTKIENPDIELVNRILS